MNASLLGGETYCELALLPRERRFGEVEVDARTDVVQLTDLSSQNDLT